MIYIVVYELKNPFHDYSGLYEELKRSKGWWHHLKYTWLISTNESPKQLRDRLSKHLIKGDKILIIEAGSKRSGLLPKKAWEWLRNHLD